MRTPQRTAQIRDEAVALRLAGKSVREIKDALGPVGKRTLSAALKGTPPAEWTRRPNAKDDLRDQARELRTQGQSYNEARAAHHVAESAAAAAEIGDLTDREVLIAGAIAYWCEGSKSKPYRRSSDRVIFTNSDPGLVRFFLRFLDVVGTQRSGLRFTVQIHENADVEAAQRFWEEVTGAPSDLFGKPTLKHHNPKTTRGNVGVGYHGCLRIEVRRSGELYRKIDGWASAAMAA